MSRRNLEVVESAFAAYFDGDLDKAAEFADPDLVVTQFEELPDGRTYHGRSGFIEAIAGWEAEWDDLQVEPLRAREVGDHVIVTLRQTARGRGSGAEVESEYTFVLTFDDGRIVRWQMFTDEAEALDAAGVPVYG